MSRLITEILREKIEEVLVMNFPGMVEEKEIAVEPTREKSHGDFATNLAFILSRKVNKSLGRWLLIYNYLFLRAYKILLE